MQKTIVFDFDGVIHKYSKGWQDGSIYDTPNEGISDLITELRVKLGYTVIIVSTRCATEQGRNAIREWCALNGIIVDDICEQKPPALVYIDDRAIKYDPLDNNLLNEIIMFQPENKIEQNYSKLNPLEALGLLGVKRQEFKRVNDEFDASPLAKDPVVGLKILDEWTATVQKYLQKEEEEILSKDANIPPPPKDEWYHLEYKDNMKDWL